MAISLHQYCNLRASPVHGMINTHPMLCNAQKFLCPSTFVPFSRLCLWLCPLAISPCLSKAMVSTCAHWVLKAGKIKSLPCHCPVMLGCAFSVEIGSCIFPGLEHLFALLPVKKVDEEFHSINWSITIALQDNNIGYIVLCDKAYTPVGVNAEARFLWDEVWLFGFWEPLWVGACYTLMPLWAGTGNYQPLLPQHPHTHTLPIHILSSNAPFFHSSEHCTQRKSNLLAIFRILLILLFHWTFLSSLGLDKILPMGCHWNAQICGNQEDKSPKRIRISVALCSTGCQFWGWEWFETIFIGSIFSMLAFARQTWWYLHGRFHSSIFYYPSTFPVS